MSILLIPFIYMAICSGMSAVLPEVDYKAVSEQSRPVAPAHTVSAPEEK
jgi:hypothetical protein